MRTARLVAMATIAVMSSSAVAFANVPLEPISASQATKQLRTAKRVHLLEMRNAMAAPTAEFFDAVEAYEDIVDEGSSTFVDFQDVVTAYDTMQEAVRDAMDTAWSAFYVDASEALQAYAEGDDYDGTYPSAFYSGTGGPLDEFYDGAQKILSKQVDRVERRIARMAKRVKSDGFSIQYYVAAPGELRRASLTDVTFDAAPYPPFGIDGLFAFSTEAGGDGTLMACGCVGAAVGDVEVEVDGDTELLLSPPAGSRWSLLSIAGDLDPNNYLVTASHGDVTVSLPIGVR